MDRRERTAGCCHAPSPPPRGQSETLLCILQAHHNTSLPASGVKRTTTELRLRLTERTHVHI